MAHSLQFPLEIVKSYSDDKDKWFVEGFIATADVDREYDVISEKALKSITKKLLFSSTVFYNHDISQIAGKIVDAKYVSKTKAVWAKILVSKTVPKIWQLIKEGVLNSLSIRFKTLVSDVKRVFNKKLNKYVTVLENVSDVIESSFVHVAANIQAKTISWYVSKSLDGFEKGGEKKVTKEELEKEAKEEEEISKLLEDLEVPEELEKSAYTACMKKQLKAGKAFKEAAKFCAKEVKKKKGEEEEEETEEEKAIAESAEEIKSAYTACMKREMKAGKSMKEAAKICKAGAAKEPEDKKESKEEKEEEKGLTDTLQSALKALEAKDYAKVKTLIQSALKAAKPDAYPKKEMEKFFEGIQEAIKKGFEAIKPVKKAEKTEKEKSVIKKKSLVEKQKALKEKYKDIENPVERAGAMLNDLFA